MPADSALDVVATHPQGLDTLPPRAVHLTSVHPRHDNRILHKQCASLAAHGWMVTLVVADGKGDEVIRGVSVVDAGPSRNRMLRILFAPLRVLAIALRTPADVYQIHDPELLVVAGFLRLLGRRVIFDSHEHYPRALRSKTYIPRAFRYLIVHTYSSIEALICARLNAVIVADPWIGAHFQRYHKNVVYVDNFPRSDDFTAGPDRQATNQSKERQVCYVGGLTEQRGVLEMVAAMDRVKSDVRLVLAGSFDDEETAARARASNGWSRVVELGFLSRQEVNICLSKSLLGLAILHPEPNYVHSHPTKLFEYMGASIPSIASNFPVWREIVDEIGCGLCVDPLDPDAIAEAIDKLVNDTDLAMSMGNKGREAVVTKYNWEIEERKLHDVYDKVAGLTRFVRS